MTTKILLSKITKDSPFQTRVPDPEEIQKLAGAIKRDGGIKQPPHVRVQTPPEGVTWKVADYEYEIIFGHNRIAAARLLGWTEIDVEVDKVSDLEAHRMTISENASRADLSQLELAKQMAGARVAFGIDETARMFKMTPATVLTYLHILDLPEEIQQKIHTGEIAKTAVPALIAYDRIMGTEETMKQIKKIGKAADVGSVVLINGMRQDLSWNSHGQFASLDDYVASRVKFPYDKAFPVKETLKWKETKIREMAGITNEGDFIQLVKLVMGGVDVLAQPFLAEPLTQKQTEIAAVAIMPPACDVCPFKVVMVGENWCSLKPCLIRKRKSWSYLQFTKYLDTSNLQKYSETKDGIGLPIDISMSDRSQNGSSKNTIHEKYSKMIEKGDTKHLRIQEAVCDGGGKWAGTANGYARLVDCTPAQAKKAAKIKADRAAQRSNDGMGGYYSPENVARREEEEKIGKLFRSTYKNFLNEKVLGLILPLMKITIPEMTLLFGDLKDKHVNEFFGTEVNDKNRLAMYRRYFLFEKHQWNEWQAARKGIRNNVNEVVKPLLEALGIAIPEGFDQTLEDYIKEQMEDVQDFPIASQEPESEEEDEEEDDEEFVDVDEDEDEEEESEE